MKRSELKRKTQLARGHVHRWIGLPDAPYMQCSEREAIEAAAIATADLAREGVGNPGPDFFSTPYARASVVAAYPFIARAVAERVAEEVRAEPLSKLDAIRDGNYWADFIESLSDSDLLGGGDSEPCKTCGDTGKVYTPDPHEAPEYISGPYALTHPCPACGEGDGEEPR